MPMIRPMLLLFYVWLLHLQELLYLLASAACSPSGYHVAAVPNAKKHECSVLLAPGER